MGMPHSPTCVPPALPPAVTLARRAHQLRALPRVPLEPGSCAVSANQVAAESSVALMLLLIEPWLDPPRADQRVSITDHLAVALRAVTNVITTETTQEVGAPLLSNLIQRDCVVAAPLAVVAVQATLLVVLAAFADGAMQVVVALPRSHEAQVVLEIQTDAAGIAGRAAGPDRDRLRQWVGPIGGSVTVEEKPPAWWTTRIAIPHGVTDGDPARIPASPN